MLGLLGSGIGCLLSVIITFYPYKTPGVIYLEHIVCTQSCPETKQKRNKEIYVF